MTRARIGVIGTGWWATDIHIPALRAHPEADLVALCDTDPERLEAAASEYGVDHSYTDVEAMLEAQPLDGAVVASSNASHYAVARACLERGLHVMLEKPMTLRARDAGELVELAAARGRELIVGYPYNYTPYARRAREVLAAGELGRVQFVNLFFNSHMTPIFSGTFDADFAVHGPDQYVRPERSGGGHGQVQITHAAGLLFFVSGLRPQRVSALMADHGLGIDLVDAMAVAFDGGALGTVGGSGNEQGLTFRLFLGCEQGRIDIDAAAGVATIERNGAEAERLHTEPGTLAYPSHATAHNLVAVIVRGAGNGSPAEVGWRASELLDAAYRSAALQGRPITREELYREDH